MRPDSTRGKPVSQRRWGAIGVVALAYLIAGRLALQLAIPPGYAAAVWPAAGIAIACVLIAGTRVIPGVWIGSFLTNLWISFDGSTVDALLGSLATAAVIAFGAALQAWAGARLVGGGRRESYTMRSEREILRFFLMGGVVAAVISPTVGVTTLWLSGIVAGVEYAYSWATWWAGDAIGAFTFGPLLLVFAGRPRAHWRRMRLPIGAPLIAAVALTVVVFVSASHGEMAKIRGEFDRLVDGATRDMASAVREVEDDLHDLAALYASSHDVDADEFAVFAHRILNRGGGARALEWVPRVNRDEFAEWTERGRRLHGEFLVWERAPDGRRVAVAGRDCHYPVFYLEPHLGNEAAIGFDIGSEERRREAIGRCIATGEVAFTANLALVQGTGKAGGLAVLAVHRRPDGDPAAGNAGGDRIAGLVAAAYEVADLMAPVSDRLAGTGLVATITEGGGHRLWSSSDGGAGAEAAPAFTVGCLLLAGGRPWDVEVTANREFIVARRSPLAWALLLGGMLFSGLMGMLLLITIGRTLTVEQQVEERTFALQRANVRLAGEVESHMRTEVALRASERNLVLAQASAKLGSIEFDLDRDTATWSAETFRLVGRERHLGPAGLAEFVQEHVHADDRAAVLAASRRVIDTGRGESLDVRPAARGGPQFLDLRLEQPEPGIGRSLTATLLDVSERKRSEQLLRDNLTEKEALLQEVHHRVKNNLQVVCSMLGIQARREPAIAALLRESQDRIMAMSEIHEMLYRTGDFANVDVPAYLQRLCARLLAAHAGGVGPVRFEFDLQPAALALAQAVPLGLLTNELVTNVLRHAFPRGRAGTVVLSLRVYPEGGFELQIVDDGVGCVTDTMQRPGSVGLGLVQILSRQLGAEFRIEGGNGTRAVISCRTAVVDEALVP